MSSRGLVGFVAAACVVCCIGPLLALLGGVVALGALSTAWIGAAGLIVTGVAVAAIPFVRRRRRCRLPSDAVPVNGSWFAR